MREDQLFIRIYCKRFWNETTGAVLTDAWGSCTYFFETDRDGNVLRQMQVYANRNKLRYTHDYSEDEYGGLSEVPLDLAEFDQFRITREEFEKVWFE